MGSSAGQAKEKEAAAAEGASTSAPKADKSISNAFQTNPPGIKYLQYSLELEPVYLSQMRELISKDLSEPYSIYVYRYFLYQWAELCFMAVDTNDHDKLVGVVICKLERHRGGPMRGYIAMLATNEQYRGKGIATTLVSKALDLMIEKDADEIALETEETNTAAMKLYERLGFLRSKKLHRYYLNGNSAYRLLLYLKQGIADMPTDYDAYRDLPPSAQDGPNFPPSKDDLYSRGIV
jgi:N-alpha-acetyltransferase 30